MVLARGPACRHQHPAKMLRGPRQFWMLISRSRRVCESCSRPPVPRVRLRCCYLSPRPRAYAFLSVSRPHRCRWRGAGVRVTGGWVLARRRGALRRAFFGPRRGSWRPCRVPMFPVRDRMPPRNRNSAAADLRPRPRCRKLPPGSRPGTATPDSTEANARRGNHTPTRGPRPGPRL